MTVADLLVQLKDAPDDLEVVIAVTRRSTNGVQYGDATGAGVDIGIKVPDDRVFVIDCEVT